MGKATCKKCLIEEITQANEARIIREAISAIPPESRASEETTEGRLSACFSCPRRLTVTCLENGRYVEIQASIKEKFCPLSPPKWGKEEEI